MSVPSRRSWVPLLFFWLTLVVSAVLIVLVFLSPLLDNGAERPHGWSRWLAVFARDKVLRRTTLASALGLVVTACVFFRSPAPSRPAARKSPRGPKPPSHSPPGNMAGA